MPVLTLYHYQTITMITMVRNLLINVSWISPLIPRPISMARVYEAVLEGTADILRTNPPLWVHHVTWELSNLTCPFVLSSPPEVLRSVLNRKDKQIKKHSDLQTCTCHIILWWCKRPSIAFWGIQCNFLVYNFWSSADWQINKLMWCIGAHCTDIRWIF